MNGQARLDHLGITPENASVYGFTHPEKPTRGTWQLFAAEPNGDIKIWFADLHGNKIQYDKNGKLVDYVVTRFAVPKVVIKDGKAEERKYESPWGGGNHLFIPPRTINAWQNAEAIDTLVIIEGEFKAMAGSLFGLHTVGIRGIHNIKDSQQKKLFSELTSLLDKCNVANVIILFDADALDYEHDSEKDTSKRLFNFYYAVRNLREALKPFRDKLDLYFSIINPEHGHKGLDDLLCAHRPPINADIKPSDVVADLLDLADAGTYFQTLSLGGGLGKVQAFFGIEDVNQFYQRHRDRIADQVFWFQNRKYQRDETGELKLLGHGDVRLYARIGTQYFKTIKRPLANGTHVRELQLWSLDAIKQDYVFNKLDTNFVQNIPRYDTFCNVPANEPSTYQQVVDGCYNLYYPVAHVPEPGRWDTIAVFLKHLFANKHQDVYEIMLDYLALAYQVPTQKLPIVVLASEERNTGKSTFIKLLELMFLENVMAISNDEIENTFTEHFAGKLFICINEGLIEKRKTGEKLKDWATASSINMRGMYKGFVKVDFFAKLVITTNNERDFLRIDEQETRFLVAKVAPYEKEDPHLVGKMQAEIPAFLHYLKERFTRRTMKYPTSVSRFWFPEADFQTEAVRAVKAASASWKEKDLRIMIEDYILDHKLSGEVRLTENDILAMYKAKGLQPMLPNQLRELLKNKWKVPQRNGQYLKYRLLEDAEDPERNTVIIEKKYGRYYAFQSAHYIGQELTDEHALAYPAHATGSPEAEGEQLPF